MSKDDDFYFTHIHTNVATNAPNRGFLSNMLGNEVGVWINMHNVKQDTVVKIFCKINQCLNTFDTVLLGPNYILECIIRR